MSGRVPERPEDRRDAALVEGLRLLLAWGRERRARLAAEDNSAGDAAVPERAAAEGER